MKYMFKYLAEHKRMILCIIVLLVIQAYCDLSLPAYTSDIVDVGIQQKGIEGAVPDEMRPDTLESLTLFMTDKEEQEVRKAYALNADGNMELTKDGEKERESLDPAFGRAMLMMSTMEESGKIDAAQLGALVDSGQVTREQLQQAEAQAMDKFGDYSESLIAQKAVLFIQKEYQEMGINLDDYQMNYLLRNGGIMLALAVLAMAASVAAAMLASYTAAKVGMTLRNRVFKKVLHFTHAEMDQFSTASLITRSTNDIQQIQMVSVMLLRMVMYAPIIGIGGIIKVANTRTGLGWIIAVAVVAIVVVVGILMSVTMPKFKIMQTLVDRLNLVSREILTGLPVIRAFSREKYEEKRFAAANQDLKSTQLFTNRIMTFMMPAMMLIMNCITVLIVWVGGKGIDLGNLQVGDMMAFITYTMQIVMAFLMLTMISIMLPRAGVAAARINEVSETTISITDKENTKDDSRENWDGCLSFEHVSFKYPGADENALEDLNFTAEPGKTTAIIGSTGCGKTTLLNLIPRFYDVTDGRITMDGVDIRDLSMHKLRELLGMVPQKGVLFSGTIESNIKFAGDMVSDDLMKEAAEISQATEFIDEKPKKYQSSISQGGNNVSGGQKQRLSIARAIAKRPKVLLFDDSFSALDYKTDAVLRRTLNERVKDATVIIVAQRISTILHADQILVLDDGKIVGKGTHQELMEQCESYQEIAKSQLSEAELKGGCA
ncbi:ABC transporter ATP-binding protein/permease [Lawsonibacter sp. OA9]|uniref:ABC transporter ATP-binding protein n=1 Tax=Oscillospiraceae TaxID=216572 RepID=UPI001F058F9C|nr:MULTISPECIES: ABC transporter ATP-binding protein [Oscillospiraceae]MCH1978177.1 ABC transporter ATP-binding protein/permease [Lawsonibacter sp. OA9]MCH1983724.1 ABC transporter ATP-binding protein/permease [Ruminococcus sp. OA3]